MLTKQQTWAALAFGYAFSGTTNPVYVAVGNAYTKAATNPDVVAAERQLNVELAAAFALKRDSVSLGISRGYNAAAGVAGAVISAPDLTVEVAGTVDFNVLVPGHANSEIAKVELIFITSKGVKIVRRCTAGTFGYTLHLATANVLRDGVWPTLAQVTLNDGTILWSTPQIMQVKNAVPVLYGSKMGFAFGGQEHGYAQAIQEADIQDAFDVGGRWVRIDCDMSVLKPTSGPADFSHIDHQLDKAAALGMSILLCPNYNSQWSSGNANAKCGVVSSGNQDDWAAFAAELTSHAIARVGIAFIKAVEVYNEPNNNSFWLSPDVVAYTNLLKKAYPAIKAVNSSVQVLTGGTAPLGDIGANPTYPYHPVNWVKGIYANGGKNYLDGVCHHIYDDKSGDPPIIVTGQPGWGWHAFSYTQEIRKTMVDNGDSAKKVWATEAGSAIGDPAVNSRFVPASQAVAALNGAVTKWLTDSRYKDWTGPYFLYRLRDYTSNPSDPEANFGVETFDRTHKANWSAYQTLAGTVLA